MSCSSEAPRRGSARRRRSRGSANTLAERAWRTLGQACDERIAVGKVADGLDLAFPIVDDATAVRAPIAGVVAGLGAAHSDLCVFLPVDCPLVYAALFGVGEMLLRSVVTGTILIGLSACSAIAIARNLDT